MHDSNTVQSASLYIHIILFNLQRACSLHIKCISITTHKFMSILQQKMYHQHQGPRELFTTRTTFPMERHLFLHGGNTQGDSGLVLSTDAKPRLKWTPKLHQRFVDAVNQLGGVESKIWSLYTKCKETSLILTLMFITQKLLQKQSWGLWAFQDLPYTRYW
jgi:hypothetical protein